MVLPDALHSIRSLLCTATNATPHERMFKFQRRSSSGHSVPSWLTTAETAYLRKRVRQSKYEPLVEEVEILHSNPEYAHVRLPSGIESTVSIRDLAPCHGATDTASRVPPPIIHPSSSTPLPVQDTVPPAEEVGYTQEEPVIFLNPVPPPATAVEAGSVDAPRRSSRVTRPVQRLIDEM